MLPDCLVRRVRQPVRPGPYRTDSDNYASDFRRLAEMDRNGPVKLKNSFLQKIKLKLDKIEDSYLGAEIPEEIRRHLTFYRLHVLYFLLISIWGTLILYLAHRSDAGERRFTVVDSIFNVVSVVTVTGIMSVRIADLSLFDRLLLIVLMTLGSPAFCSLIPLCVRRFYFFRHHRLQEKERMKETSSMNVAEFETQSFPQGNPGTQFHFSLEHSLAECVNRSWYYSHILGVDIVVRQELPSHGSKGLSKFVNFFRECQLLFHASLYLI